MSPEVRIIGIDFDNTIVSYDRVLSGIARERGWIDSESIPAKRTIRDRIRALPGGDREWQRVQALLYGERISEAALAEGVADFLAACRERGIQIYIVSHKTESSGCDTTTNLRDAASQWMRRGRFFEKDGLGLSPECVSFADNRPQKIERIAQLGCTHFIDDLEEIFLDRHFPASVARILYEPGRQSPPPCGVTLTKTWQEISEHFFGI